MATVSVKVNQRSITPRRFYRRHRSIGQAVGKGRWT